MTQPIDNVVAINNPLTHDDGSWTPVLGATSVDGTHTYTVQYGEFFKIGDIVFANFNIEINTLGSTISGDIVVRGLPEAASLDTNRVYPISQTKLDNVSFLGLPKLYVSAGATDITLTDTIAGAGPGTITNTMLGTSVSIGGTAIYKVD